MARKESQELRSNEETSMLKIKSNKSSGDLDVDLDVPLFKSIKSNGDDDNVMIVIVIMNLLKEINRLLKEINRLLKEINSILK